MTKALSMPCVSMSWWDSSAMSLAVRRSIKPCVARIAMALAYFVQCKSRPRSAELLFSTLQLVLSRHARTTGSALVIPRHPRVQGVLKFVSYDYRFFLALITLVILPSEILPYLSRGKAFSNRLYLASRLKITNEAPH